jgi:hypothetical protein
MFEDIVIEQELNRLVSQLEISDSHILFRGKQYAILPQHLKISLINILYAECYALKERCQTGIMQKQVVMEPIDEAFIVQLSASNRSTESIQEGWQVKSNFSNGYLELTKGLVTKIIAQTSLINSDTAPTIGTIVTIKLPKEDRYRQPTFYYVFSNQNISDFSKKTRIYWNINSAGASLLIACITQKLNYYNIPFIFKCLSHPDLYFRRDAAVLYIENQALVMVMELLPAIIEVVKDYLEEDVPLFAYKFKKGIGIAEDPDTNESFGMHRMAMVAETIIDNIPNKYTAENMVAQIAIHFEKKGINPATPFLNKGSKILF